MKEYKMFEIFSHNGFFNYLIPIMPIGCKISKGSKIKKGGKIPAVAYSTGWGGFKNWQSHVVTHEDISDWDSYGASFGTKNAGVGIRTSGFPFIDIDIDNNDLLVAKIKKIVFEVLGTSCIRYRDNTSRCGIVYKMKPQYSASKVIINFNNGENLNKVEILGDGQQFVAYGEHSSGNSYKWIDPDQKENFPRTVDLPEVTPEDIVKLTDKLMEMAELLGFTSQVFKKEDTTVKLKNGKTKKRPVYAIASKTTEYLDYKKEPDLKFVSFSHGNFTLKELVENPEVYDGARCMEIREPTYNNSQEDIVEIYNNGSTIVCHSFAHGGINYIIQLPSAVTYLEFMDKTLRMRDKIVFNSDVKNKKFWKTRDNSLVSKVSAYKIYMQAKDALHYTNSKKGTEFYEMTFRDIAREIHSLYANKHVSYSMVLALLEGLLDNSRFFSAKHVDDKDRNHVVRCIWKNIQSEFIDDSYEAKIFNDSTVYFYELNGYNEIQMVHASTGSDRNVTKIINSERLFKVSELLKKLATIKLGKEVLFVRMLINKKYQFDVDYSTKDGIKNLLSNSFVYVVIKKDENNVKIEKKEIFNIWMSHSDRIDFKGEVFRPHSQSSRIESPYFFKGSRNKKDTEFLNLFMGYSYYPVQGDCKIILDHIRYAWCGGNLAVYNFVIKWYAFMLQYPGVSPEVSWIINSDQGLGKGLIDSMFERFLGVHYLKVEKIEDITGQFNDSLYKKILVNNNEATQINEKTVHSVLKAYQDAKSYLMNAKGAAKRTVELCLHLTTFSNTGYFVKLEKKERRNFFIVPDNDYVERVHGDKDKYYDKLDTCCNSNGALGFMAYLLNIDLSIKHSETYSHKDLYVNDGDTFEEFGDFSEDLPMKENFSSYFGVKDSVKYSKGVLFEDDYTTEIESYSGWHPRNMPIIYNPDRTENIIENLSNEEKWWISKLASGKFSYNGGKGAEKNKSKNNDSTCALGKTNKCGSCTDNCKTRYERWVDKWDSVDSRSGHFYHSIKEDYEGWCAKNKIKIKERNIRGKVKEFLCGGRDKLKVAMDDARISGKNKYLDIEGYIIEKKHSGYDKIIIKDLTMARKIMEKSLDKGAVINWESMVDNEDNVVKLFGM